VLETVRQTLFNAEECRERADLESKLYSRWRLGLDHEKILKDSKNTHHAVAKLSWLDRQIENQMHNEQQKQETQKLELELEHEKRKHEAYVQSCQQLRDSEINQVRSLHENNICELKLRERELHDAKMTENVLRKKLGEVQKELEGITSTNNKRRDRIQALHNFRRIKMLMKERSDAIKRDIAQDLNLLDRISFDKDFDNDEEIKYLKEKFHGEFDNEVQNLKHIECMYESEAKDAFKKQEEKWNDEAMVREQQLKVIVDDRMQTLNERINQSVRTQQELCGIREQHLKAIEDCNRRLKELMSESLSSGLNDVARKTLKESTANENNSNSNLNGIIRKTDNLMINGHHYQLTAPRFARKKVAWT
jgi:trichoplein keratin filament-binding protein